MKRFLALAISAAIMVVLGGCGGGDLNSSTASSTIASKPEGVVENRNFIKGTMRSLYPLKNATIKVYDKNLSLVSSLDGASDENGNFSIPYEPNSFPLFLKAKGGEANGTAVEERMFSICFSDQCNITPVTTLLALSFMDTSRYTTQEDVDGFAQKYLGIDTWQSVSLAQVESMAKYAQEKKMGIEVLSRYILQDLKDGYLDEKDLAQLFPAAPRRVQSVVTLEVDTSQIKNAQKRDFVVKNLLTGEEYSLDDSVSVMDYDFEIALVEKEKYYSFGDGAEKMGEKLIYLGFPPYSSSKIDLSSTLFSSIFLDAALVRLTNEEKKKIIEAIPERYGQAWEGLKKSYLKYINKGELYEEDYISKVQTFREVVKEDFISSSGDIHVDEPTPMQRYVKKVIDERSVGGKLNRLNLSGLTILYNQPLNKFVVRNRLPKYYGLVTAKDYNKFQPYLRRFGDLDGLKSSIGHNLVTANSAGIAGMAISSYMDFVSDGKVGGEETVMLCEEFDGDICEQDKLKDYRQTYVLYSGMNPSSLAGTLNLIDTIKPFLPVALSVKKLNVLLEAAKGIDKYAHMFRDKYGLLKFWLDSLLDGGEIFIHLLAKVDSLKNEREEWQNIMNGLRNQKANIEQFADTFFSIYGTANIFLPSQKEIDDFKKTKPIEVFASMFLKGSGLKNVYDLGKILKNIPLLKNYEISFQELEGKDGYSLDLAVASAAFLIYLALDEDKKEKDKDNNDNDLLSQAVSKNEYKIKSDNLFVQVYIGTQAMLLWSNYQKNKEKVDNYIQHLVGSDMVIRSGGGGGKVDTYKALLDLKNYFLAALLLADTSSAFKKIKSRFEKITEILQKIDFLAKLKNYSYSHVNFTEVKRFIVEFILVPMMRDGLKEVESGIKDELLQKLAMLNPWTRGAYVANELAGKVVALAFFPNKLTFGAEAFSKTKSVKFFPSISPIGFEKGIRVDDPKASFNEKAFLKLPTEDDFSTVVVISDKQPAKYFPFFVTYFQEGEKELEKKLDDIYDEKKFVEIDWQYKKCPEESVKAKMVIESERCEVFVNDEGLKNYIHTVATGDQLDDDMFKWGDDFIESYLGGSKFDYFKYLASTQGWEVFPVQNRTRGVFIDAISAKYFGADGKNASAAESPVGENVIFRIANARDISLQVEELKDEIRVTNNSNIDVACFIVGENSLRSRGADTHYHFDLRPGETRIVYKTNLALPGLEHQSLYLLAVDALLQKYALYTGKSDAWVAIKAFGSPSLSWKDYISRYTQESHDNPYPFISLHKLSFEPNMAPRIELYDVKVDKEELSATLTVSASDPDGDELEVGVEWFDADSKPVITLKGDNPLTITVGEEYVDPGATAYDEEDGDLSDQIVITGTVDTSTPGEYTVTYTVRDSAGNTATAERTVIVVDADSKPVITLKGDNPLTITVGEEYVDPGATAYDEEDGDLSDQIVITGTVDTSTPGEYTVTYTVRDSAGNTATATRVVKVVEPDPTYTLSLLGQEPSAGAKISPDIGDSFTQVWELKLTANHDATLSLSPITGSCDLKILDDDKAKDLQVEEGESFEAAVIYETPTADGNYTCLFEVKDSEGHSYTVDGEDYLVTFIHLVTKPLAVNTDLDTQVQVGTDATLLVQVNSGNPPYQISIDWGDGEVTATSFSAQSASYAHAYNEAGTYTVTVELTDAASKSYRRVYTVEVYEEVPLQSEWEGVVDPVHSDGSSGPEQGVEIIAEPIDGVDGMATYSLDYELGSGDLFYYAGYKLPVPQGLITLDKKVRVSYLLQIDTSTGLWEYDREHWLKSDAKKFGVVIEDFHDGTNLDGVWIVKDLAEGTERRETVAEFVDEVVSHGGYSGYALEIDGGKLTVYRYDQRDDGSFTGSMTQVRSFDVGAGEYLTQLHVDTKGPSKLIYAKIEYDLNGDGDYEDANESLDLTTLTKSVDWSRFDLGKEDEPIPVATSRLKKTGQTKSYDQDGNEVERCAVKDDGCYQAGVDPRYTRDDATGIVTDHVTGLQWQDDYSDNGGKVKMATWEDAVAYCESLKLGGYGDWSLPEIYELETLFDYGKRMPAVDAIFKNLQSFDYWSSTEFVANADYYAWQARFSSGVTGFFTDKYSPYPYVMCKREK